MEFRAEAGWGVPVTTGYSPRPGAQAQLPWTTPYRQDGPAREGASGPPRSNPAPRAIAREEYEEAAAREFSPKDPHA
jgi:hypothetical protein